MNFTKDKSDLMGIFLLILGLLLFAFLICTVIKMPFISNDEWYTMGMMQLPLHNIIKVTAGDVHPPMFYIILYGFMSFFKLLSIDIDLIYIMKITAMVPYILLFILSITKIRKDYGLLTAGVFSFTIIAMSDYFYYFLIGRMYTWPLLFLILAFICIKELIEKRDFKYWLLLTVFSVLAAYSHYFAAIPIILIYLALLVYLLLNRNEEFFKPELKKYFISAILGILCYLPWTFVLLNQMKQVHSSYHINTITLDKIIEFFAYYLSISNNKFIQLGACIIILFVFLILMMKYANTKKAEDFYVSLGVFAFIATIGFALMVSFIFRPILTVRYLIPVIGLVWLCISIKLGSVDFKKIALPIILLLIVVGAFNVYHEFNDIRDEWSTTVNDKNVLDSINNEDTVMVYLSTNKYCRFNGYLDNVSEKYSAYVIDNKTSDISFAGLDLNYDPLVIPDDLKDHSDKNIYVPLQDTRDPPKGDGFKFTEIAEMQHSKIYKIESK